MKTLILLPRAEVDVIEAALWYDAERPGLGRIFEEEFDQLANRIQTGPLQFPTIEPDVRRAMLGRFPYGVFFVVEEAAVVVIAVLHLHGDPENVRRRR